MINVFEYGKSTPLYLFCIRFTSEEPGVVFVKKQPSDDEQRSTLIRRRGIHPPAALPAAAPPQASTSTDSGICSTRFGNSATRIRRTSPVPSRHSRNRNNPLLQQQQLQLAHLGKWLLPVALLGNAKRSSDCLVMIRKRTENFRRFLI